MFLTLRGATVIQADRCPLISGAAQAIPGVQAVPQFRQLGYPAAAGA
jgi:hypothetical protein